MISLDLARKLKSAGLEWEPQQHADWFISPGGNIIFKNQLMGLYGHRQDECVWLPSLSQLLGEVEGRGYLWSLDHSTASYYCQVGKWRWAQCFRCDTPEEAAGQALLWIIERSSANAQHPQT